MIAIALALCAGCKKKSKEESKPVDLPVAVPPVAVAPARPLPATKPGPAYFTMGKLLVRYDAEGWTRLALDLTGRPRFAPALGPHVVIVGDSVYRLKDDKLVEVPSLSLPTSVSVATDGTIWALADGKVVRAPAETFLIDDFKPEDPLRGLAIASDGSVWLHTLDRTYVRAGDSWRPVDVPNVTGQVADILQLAAHPQGDLYLVTSIGLHRRTGDRWAPIGTGFDTELTAVLPGPADRFAVVRKNYELRLGDSRGTRELEQTDLRIIQIDGSGRLWLVTGDGIRVKDFDGKLLRFFRSDETPGGTAFDVSDLRIVDGGPPVNVGGERARGKVTGKVEGSAAGVAVIVCTSSKPDFNTEPCEGVDNTRRTMTVAGGRFTIEDVPLAPLKFWVKRGEWRFTVHDDCCDHMLPDATFDIGTLRLK